MTERRAERPRTATTSVVSQVNLTAIVETLQELGPLSRRQLCERTGLSPATVNRLTAQLIEQGLIVRAGVEASDKGRPSHLLRYAGETRVVGAVHVKESAAMGVLQDLTGAIVHRERVAVELPRAASPEAAARARLTACLALADALLDAAASRQMPCLGLGVSIPGYVRASDGHVFRAAELHWREVPLGELLAARVDVPCIVENDANAIAYAEWSRGSGQGSDTLVAIELGVGIGAGIITEGRLHRGSRWVAGEIGFLLTERSSLRVAFGDVGDLESRIGAHALEREAAALGWGHDAGPVIPWIISTVPDSRLAEALFDLVALAVASLTNVLDPDAVVLGGALATDPELVRSELTARLTDRIPFPPRLLDAALGADAALVGVAELIARRVQHRTYVQS